MKMPAWFPQSFFARIILLVLSVVLFSKALTLAYLMLNEEMLVDRQYTHGAALTLRSFWAADESQRDQIAAATGLRRAPLNAVPKAEEHFPYSRVFLAQMRTELGPNTLVRLRMHGQSALWVYAPSLGPDWVMVPLYPFPLSGERILGVLGWFLAIGLLSTAAAWIFVSQLNAPFKRLVVAARQFGQGRSVRLPMTDSPHEMAEVYRAFNQMARTPDSDERTRFVTPAYAETGSIQERMPKSPRSEAVTKPFSMLIRRRRNEPLARNSRGQPKIQPSATRARPR